VCVGEGEFPADSGVRGRQVQKEWNPMNDMHTVWNTEHIY
jgi:hypothetical protein